MLSKSIRRPSPALIVAIVALIAALTGSAIALPGKNTVTSNDIAKNAVRSSDVKNDSLKGKDIKESSLGQVPSAARADSAGRVDTQRHVGPVRLAEGQEQVLDTRGPFTLTAERVAEGEAVLVRYEGKHGEENAIGVVLLGFDGQKREVHVTWVDSFHTGGGPMVLTGPLRDDVVADVVGTWYWEGQPFGWRIEIRRTGPDRLEWSMFNRMDQEYPATACTFTRA